MNKKIISGYIGAILIILLMVSSATALNLTRDNSVFEKPDDKKDSIEAEHLETNNDPEEKKPAGFIFPMIIVQVKVFEQIGWFPRSGVTVFCSDVSTGEGVYSKTHGFLGWTYFCAGFYRIEYGHTYELHAKDYTGKQTIKISNPVSFVPLAVK